MRILLDTQAFLWFIFEDAKLSSTAAKLIGAPGNVRLLSMASIWEIAIKVQLRKLDLPRPLDHFLGEQLARNQVQLLPISFDHSVNVYSLPYARAVNGQDHKDPFDRLIVSQALIEDVPLVSSDGVLDEYGVDRRW